ncbi:hypothetical protein J6590_091239 [Homalodisca vitripennis]|nr:hypothetical protein J6590_091239 [Homalodisca vitripennis]
MGISSGPPRTSDENVACIQQAFVRSPGLHYLEMLENWLFPQLEQEAQLILQQDGAPPHWQLYVRDYLNVKYLRRWIGR